MTAMSSKGDATLVSEGLILNMIAGDTILAGMVVGFAADGADWTVIPTDSTISLTGATIGVALEDVVVGESVAVASIGSIVYVREADEGTIDAGDWLTAGVLAGGAIPYVDSALTILGVALEDAAAHSWCKCLITLGQTGT